MHDTIIRGGTVVDGTGAPAFTADVAVRDGLIVEVGRIAAPARAEIDADGALVKPASSTSTPTMTASSCGTTGWNPASATM